MTRVQTEKIEELKKGFQGEVILPGDGAYDDARKIWNAMIDKRPAVIARCASDPGRRPRGQLRAATTSSCSPSAAAGTTSPATPICDDGLVDRPVADEGRRRWTPAGAARPSRAAPRWRTSTPPRRRTASPPRSGINSTTGIAGLTLGGGFGWLSRKYGMTVDNLESAEVVTAAGQVVRASATEHPDLFWALRGGGGNFGVVTRFEFRLHPVGPDVSERAHRVLRLRGEEGAPAVPGVHRQGAGRAHRVDCPAPGAAAAVPAREGPRQGDHRARV